MLLRNGVKNNNNNKKKMGSKDASPDPWAIILLQCNSFLYVIHFNLLCIKNENIELNAYVYTVCVYIHCHLWGGGRRAGRGRYLFV